MTNKFNGKFIEAIHFCMQCTKIPYAKLVRVFAVVSNGHKNMKKRSERKILRVVFTIVAAHLVFLPLVGIALALERFSVSSNNEEPNGSDAL